MTIHAPAPADPADPAEPSLFTRHFRGMPAALGYLLLNFPLALVGFVGTITLFSVGLSTVIIWIGLPILVLSALYARGFATVERGLQRSLLDREAPSAYAPVRGNGRVARVLGPLRDPQSWLDQLWSVLHLIVSVITFSIALTWTVGAACTVLGPIATFVLQDRDLSSTRYFGISPSPWQEALVQGALGLLFLVSLPWVARGLAAGQAAVAYALLSQRAEHRRTIGDLRSSRAAGQWAETDQLRRLERDIHDGPQQRLVRLNMDLARARRMAVTDPENVQLVLAGAMEQTQEALAELRMLSRGIAPPLLVDRGLAAAVTEAAGRSLVAIQVAIDVPRLPTPIETCAYFVISEALANLNKHSAATSAQILAGVEDEWLFITVTDDGIGGADPAKGHGLAGLAERLRSVDGRLDVDSPPGGPTVLQAVISCAS